MNVTDEERDYFAILVIEYMIGEWNKISNHTEKIIRTLLRKGYTEHLIYNQFRFIEQQFGMLDEQVNDWVTDATDLINAIEIYKEETRLKFWDKTN